MSQRRAIFGPIGSGRDAAIRHVMDRCIEQCQPFVVLTTRHSELFDRPFVTQLHAKGDDWVAQYQAQRAHAPGVVIVFEFWDNWRNVTAKQMDQFHEATRDIQPTLIVHDLAKILPRSRAIRMIDEMKNDLWLVDQNEKDFSDILQRHNFNEIWRCSDFGHEDDERFAKYSQKENCYPFFRSGARSHDQFQVLQVVENEVKLHDHPGRSMRIVPALESVISDVKGLFH